MTNLEIIRQACIKANPSILDLKFGCEIRFVDKEENYCFATVIEKSNFGIHLIGDEFNRDWWIESIHQDNYEILGREIRLADVLLMISALLSSDSRYYSIRNKLLENWWLVHNLENQREERLKFLADLIKEKNYV